MLFALFVILTAPMAMADDAPKVDPATAPSGQHWICSPETWSVPGEVKHDLFVGALVSDCVITEVAGKGLAGLKEHLIAKTMTGTIHQGPFEETYDDMPGLRYEATEPIGKKNPVSVKGWIHLATDLATRLVYVGESEEVHATGMAGYLKSFNITMDVAPQPKDGSYTARITCEFTIARPWYAPTGWFKSEAASAALKSFKKSKAFVIPDIAGSL